MTDKLLVFDCFGVIVDEVAPPWLEEFFSPEEAARVKADIVRQGDLGEITSDEMFARLGALVGVSGAQAEAGWMRYAQLHDGIKELLSALRERADVVMLSDAPNLFLRRVLDRHGLLELFSAVYISSELHMVKPDPAFFRYVLADRGAAPEHAIMIDDRIKNVRGAESVGMQGLLYDFDSVPAFARALKARLPSWELPI